jgi:NADH-quinone oxidoreductase subunit M
LFSSLGLPELNGFVGEFLIFKGSFPLAPWATAGATLGLLLTAVFLLRFLERVFLGPLNPRWTALPDLDWRERLAVAPLLLLMVAIGVYPQVAVGWFNATTQAWLRGWGI